MSILKIYSNRYKKLKSTYKSQLSISRFNRSAIKLRSKPIMPEWLLTGFKGSLFQNILWISALLDILIWNPLGTIMSAKALNKQNLSKEEKRAIITKRLFEDIGSVIYWLIILSVPFLLNRIIPIQSRISLFGKGIDAEKAMKGFINLATTILGHSFNEIVKPIFSTIFTAKLLNYFKNYSFENNPISWIYKLFQYKED